MYGNDPDGALGAVTTLLAHSTHASELTEAVRAAYPFLALGFALSVGLITLAVLPPSAIPRESLAELVEHHRRQIALVGAALSIGCALGFFVVFWSL